jgi:hypothetical protein
MGNGFIRGICFLAFVVFHANAWAEAARTQTIQLRAGWNAVFLEVFPDAPDPGSVFADTPVDLVASYYGAVSSAQFVSDPTADLFTQTGWVVWYSESRPDAFLTTLHAIQGQQAYLVNSKTDFTWKVTGTVMPPEVQWKPSSFNLVGFSVDEQAPPTFAQFFSGSKAHQHNRIYRLDNGTWRQVTDPSAESMRSGEAFWIYCDGGSKYQGPLQVNCPTRQGLVLRSGARALTLRNETDYPITATLEHVAAGSNAVPLAVVVTAVGDETAPVRSIPVAKPDGNWTQPLPVLEPGRALRVPLQVRRQDQRAFTQSSLLKITTDIGAQVWVPVFSIREDLEEK